MLERAGERGHRLHFRVRKQIVQAGEKKMGAEVEATRINLDQSAIGFDNPGQLHFVSIAQPRQDTLCMIVAESDDGDPHRRFVVLCV